VERSHRDVHEILGIGRLSKMRGVNEAEFSVLIADPWHGHGLGTRLVEELLRVGRAEGLARIRGRVLAENSVMLRI
jgi:acetyltransferase